MRHFAVCLAVAFSATTFGAQAHDVWVTSHPDGRRLTAEIGYGHHFPARGTLADRASWFAAPQLTNGANTVTLKPGAEEYVYTTDQPVAAGGYILMTQMKTSFWSRTPAGWKPADRQQYPDARYCQRSTKYARALVTVGEPSPSAVFLQPTGQAMEIVPVSDVVSPGSGPAIFQIRYQGAALAGATVELNSARYIAREDTAHTAKVKGEHHEHPAEFTAHSDAGGKATFASLPAGEWLAKVVHKQPFADTAQCDETVTVATLSFVRR